jgi:hypothetical protein
LLAVFVTGCSVINRSGRSGIKDYSNPNGANVLESIKNQNITNEGFFIQKAEIEIISPDGKSKYLASIKFEKPDKYLISIKSRTGIEGARIYISNDSLLVNDRINKKLYSGNKFYLKRKYGITPELLPLIFGDLILDRICEDNIEKCEKSNLKIGCSIDGVMIDYDIDCNMRKVVKVRQVDNFNSTSVSISFAKFFRTGSNQIPKEIEFGTTQYKVNIKIKILKVESPWNGNIKFFRGKGYELIELV